MRFNEVTVTSPLERTTERDRRFGSWLKMKIEDAIAKRYWQDETWRAVIRQYEAIPTLKQVDVNRDTGQLIVEIPIGAAMADSIASTVYDLIWNAAPPFTARGSVGYHNHAHAFQLLADKLLVDDYTNIREAANEVIIDTVQLGTGGYYTATSREVVKRAAFRELNTGPRVFSVPPEDIIFPGGTFPDIDSMQLIGHRIYYFESELTEAAAANGWDISNFMVTGNVEWVRQRRIEAAKTDVDLQMIGGLYEVFSVHCYYDYDEDGYAEDLHAIWDRTSYEVGHVSYAPYDCRPYNISRYQQRPHIFYGIGVLEMARPFQQEVTEWHNFKMQNAHLSNARVYAYRLGAAGVNEELKISPNKPIGLADPEHDLREIKMSDNYPTAQQYEAAVIALCEMRVGTPAMGPVQGVQTGKRVPAATAQSVLQQQNRRFAAPFDNIRRALAGAMTQCFMRMREEYLKGGTWKQNILEMLVYMVGPKNAALIEEVFNTASTVDMRDKIIIETTASSQSINRQADKQNAIERMQIMGAYYEKAMGLMQILANPQTPAEMRNMVASVAAASTETIKAFLRSFDDVRDPEIFIPEMLRDIGKTNGNDTEGNEGGGSPAAANPSGQPGPEKAPTDVAAGPEPSTAPTIEGSAELGRGIQDEGILG